MATNFYVIPFTNKDVEENRDVYFNIQLELALLVTAHELEEKPYRKSEAILTDVRVYKRTESLSRTEYNSYAEVYFLNNGAMRILKDREGKPITEWI